MAEKPEQPDIDLELTGTLSDDVTGDVTGDVSTASMPESAADYRTRLAALEAEANRR